MPSLNDAINPKHYDLSRTHCPPKKHDSDLFFKQTFSEEHNMFRVEKIITLKIRKYLYLFNNICAINV